MTTGGGIGPDLRRTGSREVLEAAARVFAERGYSGTSIDDIAEVLHCSKGRVYYYFRTKSDVYLAIHRQALVWLLQAVGPISEDPHRNPVAKLHDMVVADALLTLTESAFVRSSQQAIEATLANSGRGAELARLARMRDELDGMFVRVIGIGVASGYFRSGDPVILARAVLGSISWMAFWQRRATTFTTNERMRLSDDLAAFAVGGLTGAPQSWPKGEALCSRISPEAANDKKGTC